MRAFSDRAGLSIPMTTQLCFILDSNDNDPAAFAEWLGCALAGDRVVLRNAVDQAIRVKRRGPALESTQRKVEAVWNQFCRYAASDGVVFVDELTPELLSGFVFAPKRSSDGRFIPVSQRTSATRESIVRQLIIWLTEMGLHNGNPLTEGAVPRGSASSARPATSSELEQVRAFAEPGFAVGMRSAIIALRLSGGSARDVAQVYAEHVNLDAGTVTFNGRTNRLDDWSLNCLRQVIATRGADAPLYVAAPDTHDRSWIDRAAQSITVRTRTILQDAGLPDLTPTSIERGAARERHAHDLIAAATFLGSSSLDATARNLQITWSS